MSGIRPVILCGGVGTRLWPMSRAASPKQFQPIEGARGTTFFQATTLRQRGDGFTDPMALVNIDHLGFVIKQLREIQQSADIIIEPVSRNTAPALLAAALAADPDQLILSLPSDHLTNGDFKSIVRAAVPAAEQGNIVVFGIKPTYPETGYGYIVEGGSCGGLPVVRSVGAFVEKPQLDHARALIESGVAYWASGISLFKAGVLIDEFATHAPDILECVRAALANGSATDNRFMLSLDDYAGCRSVSCEYAVYEKSDRLALMPTHIEWDDVGGWDAFHRLGEKSAEGNVTSGDVVLLETANSLIRSDKRLVTVIGMSDIVVIDTEDALLIADRSKTQSVKTMVEMLSKARRGEVVEHRELVREWGTSRQLIGGQAFSLNHIHIMPEQRASFMPPESGSRYITLIEGRGEAKIDGRASALAAGQLLPVASEGEITIQNLENAGLHVIELIVGRDEGMLPAAMALLGAAAGAAATHAQ